MIPWKNLVTDHDLAEAITQSHDGLVLLFKHSTSCSISHVAKMRLEEAWSPIKPVIPYYLDLKTHRSLSNAIADQLSVHHESPQILILSDGDCIHDASHLDISMDEINEVIEHHNAPSQ